MPSELALWIDSHREVRHNLALSGMIGSISHPLPGVADVRRADPEELRRKLADDLGVDRRRLFLTHGATEANAAALLYLARTYRGTAARFRVALPEYPDLADVAVWAGFRATSTPGPVVASVLSQPRNPEGDLWAADRIERWSDGSRAVLVDETFREFAGSPSLARSRIPRLWVTGTFTKFYAGDDLRVGFVAVPEDEAGTFGRFHALLFDRLPEYSVAGALLALREREKIRGKVEPILRENRAAWRSAFPDRPVPLAPVAFDRPIRNGGDALATNCLHASVLVCPGSYFGVEEGVRLCLTRRSFPADLAAYLRVRNRTETVSRKRPTRRSRLRQAPRHRGETARGRAAPS